MIPEDDFLLIKKRNGIRKNLWTKVFFVCFLISACFANIIEVPVAFIIPSLFLIFVFFCASKEERLYYGFCVLPFIRILDGIGATYIINLILVLPLVFMFLKQRNMKSYLPIVFAILMFVIELLHMAILDYFDTFPSTMSVFLGFLYVYWILIDNSASFSFKKAWYYISWGIILSALLYFAVHPDILGNFNHFMGSGERFEAYNNDPNIYALFISMAIASFFVFPRHSIGDYFILSLLLVLGLFTGSRLYVVSTVLFFSLGTLFYLISYRNFKIIPVAVVFGLLVLVVFRGPLYRLWLNIIKRIGADSNPGFSSLTGSRWAIIGSYFQMMRDNPKILLFGYGLHYDRFLIHETMYNFAYNYQAHNTFMDFLLSWGIGGFVFIWIVIGSLIKDIGRNRTVCKRAVCFLPALSLVVSYFTLSCAYATMFWWAMAFIILPFICPDVAENNNEQ